MDEGEKGSRKTGAVGWKVPEFEPKLTKLTKPEPETEILRFLCDLLFKLRTFSRAGSDDSRERWARTGSVGWDVPEFEPKLTKPGPGTFVGPNTLLCGKGRPFASIYKSHIRLLYGIDAFPVEVEVNEGYGDTIIVMWSTINQVKFLGNLPLSGRQSPHERHYPHSDH
jgi:hypothetical protein